MHVGGKYHVKKTEWLDKNSMKVKAGDESRVRITLEPEDVDEDYFLAAYKESSVKTSGGTFVSARRDDDSLAATSRLKPVKDDFDPSEDTCWYKKNLGEAGWDKPENTSGYYELQLYWDNKSVHKVSRVSDVRCNFCPYMTKEGDYTFRVRTIPGSESVKKYDGRSKWIESDELRVTDRYVSSGKGQQAKDGILVQGAQEITG